MQAGIPERPYLRNDANRQKLGTDRRRLAHRPSCRSPPRSTTGCVLIAAIHERTNGTHNITWQLARPLRHGPWHVTVPDGIARPARVRPRRFCHRSLSAYGSISLSSFNQLNQRLTYQTIYLLALSTHVANYLSLTHGK